jgi:hypothetical protein
MQVPESLFEEPAERRPFPLRNACSGCGASAGSEGEIKPRNGQNCVYCLCGTYNRFNAPKWETGEAPKPVSTRPDIKPKRKVRLLQRDNYTCVICHRERPGGEGLHIGHLISLEDGRAEGLSDEELFSDYNLAAMCDECNLGLGKDSVTTRLQAHLLRIWMKQEGPL